MLTENLSLFLTDSAVPPALPEVRLPAWPDFTPLVWVVGGTVGVFLVIVLILLPIAVFNHGRAGNNARSLLRQILGLFGSAITAWGHRGGARGGGRADDSDNDGQVQDDDHDSRTDDGPGRTSSRCDCHPVHNDARGTSDGRTRGDPGDPALGDPGGRDWDL